jgi:hypothetical protein
VKQRAKINTGIFKTGYILPSISRKNGFSKSIVLVIKYALSPSSKLGVKKNECTTTIRTLIVIIIL